MSLKDKASLIFKPSRYKAGTAYSFRGTDFTFTRASTATRVNASGLIEDVASGVPRLSYDPTALTKDPALLLEPSRTNFLSNSNGFSSWTTYQAGVVANAAISPDGTSNAFKLINNSGTSYHFINFSYSGTTIAKSFFVKAAEYDAVGITSRSSYSFSVVFDLTRKTSTTAFDSGSIVAGHGIEEYANGWFRVWVYVTSTVQMNIHAIPSSYTGTLQGSDMPGDGTSGIYIWQAQIEGGRYPTSIIRTSGSTATRDIDIAKKTSASSVIGQSEGTIYVEFEYTGVKEHYSPLFSLQGVGSPMELIEIYAGINGTQYAAVMQDGGVTQFNNGFTPSIGKNKVAFAYATNNSVLVVNGKVIGSVDTACTIPTLYDIGLGSFTYSSSYSLGDSINEALLFKQRLSAEELTSLTSFDDYEELVDAKGLTWESSTITNNRLSELAAL